MSKRLTIAQNLLREILSYDPDTGIFRWKVDRSTRCRIGDVAGGYDAEGYVCIAINRTTYKAHRLAWMYVYGFMPKYLDHVNRNPADNRIANLRECSHSQNCMNKGQRTDNTSGFKGVHWDKESRKWRVYIEIGEKRIHIGRFDSINNAARAYNIAVIKYFGEFAELNDVPSLFSGVV